MRALDGCLHLIDGSGTLLDVDAHGGIGGDRCPERLPADVSAHLHAIELDRRHPLVGVGSGCCQIGAQPCHCQDPAASHHFAVGAGFEEQRVGKVAAEVDRRPGLWSGRITSGGCHDGARCAAESNAAIAKLTVATGERQLGEIVSEQRQHSLRLGVAEAAIELQQTGAFRREYQACVQHPDVGGALRK